jgi:hypothetical protein
MYRTAMFWWRDLETCGMRCANPFVRVHHLYLTSGGYMIRRKSRTQAKLALTRRHLLDDRRLTRVRGGEGLGITVSVPDSTPSIMEQQHNEALVRL